MFGFRAFSGRERSCDTYGPSGTISIAEEFVPIQIVQIGRNRPSTIVPIIHRGGGNIMAVFDIVPSRHARLRHLHVIGENAMGRWNRERGWVFGWYEQTWRRRPQMDTLHQPSHVPLSPLYTPDGYIIIIYEVYTAQYPIDAKMIPPSVPPCGVSPFRSPAFFAGGGGTPVALLAAGPETTLQPSAQKPERDLLVRGPS